MFEKFDDEYLEFDRVENKLSARPDMHAFRLLEQLVVGDSDLVSGANHDEIFLSIDPSDLKKIATQDQLRDLHRCGVRYDESADCLCLFV